MSEFKESWTYVQRGKPRIHVFGFTKKKYHKLPKTERIKKQLDIFHGLVTLYKLTIDSKPEKGNIQKKFTDVTSRYMNDPNASFEKFQQEMLKWKFPTPFDPKTHVADVEIDLCIQDNDVMVMFDTGTLIISPYRGRAKFLRKEGLKPLQIAEIVLTYFNMGSHSGTNWSPYELYGKLDGKKNTIECFASLFNNTWYRYKVNNMSNIPVNYILTLNECDKVFPFIKGPFPDFMDLMDDNTLLLMNPPFIEQVIHKCFEVSKEVKEKYPNTEIRMILPDWYDMYSEGPIKKISDDLGAEFKKYEGIDNVLNFNVIARIGVLNLWTVHIK